MAEERDPLRDWHRLFGLLLTDYFTGSPFKVEVERDMSLQQQLLDVVVVRKGRGKFTDRLPDGLERLVAHNLITFKSHHEALDAWSVKELVGHSVAYRKLVSPSPSELLPEDHFGLYAICARLPHNLSGQVPWQKIQAGVYDCRWGTDTIRVIVAGELPREEQNAPLHLFSASPDLVRLGRGTYRKRSENTSLLLDQLVESFRGENLAMYTMEDFKRDYFRKHFAKLTPQQRRELLQSFPASEQKELLRSLLPENRREFVQSLSPEEQDEVLQALPPEKRLAGLSEEQIRQYLDERAASRSSKPGKARRKK